MAITLEIIPFGSGDTLTLEDDAIVSLDATKVYNGIGRFSFTLRGDRRLEDRTKRQDRINVKVDGETEFTGVLTQCQQNKRTGNTNLSGKGIAKRLLEGRPDYESIGGPLTYSNEFVEDVLRDYWPRTPFGNVTVTDQPADIVVVDSEQQSADTQTEWESVLDIPATTPLFIENGFLKLAQTGFVEEAETLRSDDVSDTDYSDGGATEFTSDGDELTFEITLDYETNDLEFWVRGEELSGSFVFVIEDSGGGILGEIGRLDATLGWSGVSISGTYGPGTHTFVLTDSPNLTDSGSVPVDVVAIVDGEYHTGPFDNTVNTSNGYLDTPEKFGTTPITTTSTVDTTRNIASATVSATLNNIGASQRLGVSNDGGETFVREDNTDTLNASFTAAGRQAVTEFRLSKTDEGPQNATPRFGYNGQQVDSFSTSVDLDSRIVVVDLELSRNHFDNLKTIHEQGDFIWSIEHGAESVANIPVFSFPRGEETKSHPFDADREIDSTPEVAADQYYNTIYLQGRLLNDGTRPSAEVSDSAALAEDGREISPGLLRDLDISSDVGATFRARALLQQAQKNGELRGQKTVPATFSIQPGFSYPVVWLGDDPLEQTAESVQIRKTGDDAATTVDFVNRNGFARDIQELKRDTNNIGDQV